MKKKIISSALVLVMAICLSLNINTLAHAEDLSMIDGSYLTHEDESIGYDTKITRGEYLMTGYSKGVRLDAGVFYAGGTTIARETVD